MSEEDPLPAAITAGPAAAASDGRHLRQRTAPVSYRTHYRTADGLASDEDDDDDDDDDDDPGDDPRRDPTHDPRHPGRHASTAAARRARRVAQHGTAKRARRVGVAAVAGRRAASKQAAAVARRKGSSGGGHGDGNPGGGEDGASGGITQDDRRYLANALCSLTTAGLRRVAEALRFDPDRAELPVTADLRDLDAARIRALWSIVEQAKVGDAPIPTTDDRRFLANMLTALGPEVLVDLVAELSARHSDALRVVGGHYEMDVGTLPVEAFHAVDAITRRHVNDDPVKPKHMFEVRRRKERIIRDKTEMIPVDVEGIPFRLHPRSPPTKTPWECLYEDVAGKPCGSRFRDREKSERHARTHSGFSPFVCGKCKKEFNDDSNRKSHEKRCPGLLAVAGALDDPNAPPRKRRRRKKRVLPS